MDIRTATMLLALGTPLSATAQELVEPAPIATGDTEEITVRGERYRFQLRIEMQEAERNVYNLFNQFNDEKQYDISCSMHQISGTRLESQVCQPAFEREALALEAQDYLAAYRTFMEVAALGGDPADQNYSPPTMATPSASRIAAGQRGLQRKMQEVARENTEFLNALIRYVDIKTQYHESTSMAKEEAQ